MPSTFIVNMMTAVHASSSGMVIAFPDVCQTPSPVGPIPIPYPNIAMSSDASDQASTVKADGTGVMIASSTFSTSTGDEAGSAGGGVMSGQIKGKAYPKLYSMDVKCDGEGVFRLTDIMLCNGGSPTNTAPGTEIQAPGMASASGDGKADDSKPPRVTKVGVSPTSVCCGDEVDVEVETENFPEGVRVSLVAKVGSDRRRLPSDAQPKVSGNKGSSKWIVRRGPWQKDVKMRLRAEGLGGPCEGADELEVKSVDGGAEMVQGVMTVPRLVWVKLTTGQSFLIPARPPSKQQAWVYNIAVENGEIVVERFVELRGDGCTPTDVQKQRWKQEIETVWDKKFRLHRVDCKRGDACNCAAGHGCCNWPIRVRVTWRAGHGRPVIVHRGANPRDVGWNIFNWWERWNGVSPTVRAHEFGHMLGLYDEYGGTTPRDQIGGRDPKLKFTDMTLGLGVMHSGSQVYERYFEGFKKWFDDKFGSVVGATKLLRI